MAQSSTRQKTGSYFAGVSLCRNTIWKYSKKVARKILIWTHSVGFELARARTTTFHPHFLYFFSFLFLCATLKKLTSSGRGGGVTKLLLFMFSLFLCESVCLPFACRYLIVSFRYLQFVRNIVNYL